MFDLKKKKFERLNFGAIKCDADEVQTSNPYEGEVRTLDM